MNSKNQEYSVCNLAYPPNSINVKLHRIETRLWFDLIQHDWEWLKVVT
ncbi:hypothetical protein AM1_3104 [Acaryochloris marina MBIC11017]|uniref:Uncharacterized protein n=1 Tax=Acaryochloris marina (strain MBIC 11017) TaxID=329726 RepID=B0CDN1_ACAM1|nr:hypothetical protein AM1_3104 [Acaryochloris marina MBIC11017]